MTQQFPIARSPHWAPLEKRIISRCFDLGFDAKQTVEALRHEGFTRSVSAVQAAIARQCVLPSDGEREQRHDFSAQDAAFCARMEELGYRKSGPIRTPDYSSVLRAIQPPLRAYGSGWQIETGGEL